MIDLDARREEVAATPKEIRLGGETFILPPELPGDVLAPFLAADLGLVDLLADAIANSDDKDEIGDMVFELLGKNPSLPSSLVTAGSDALKALIGADRYPVFLEKRPTVPEYLLIAQGLFTEYGMSLGDFFGSSSSSETPDEQTDSKQTLPDGTPAPTPTSEASGAAPETPDSSASAG
jgi:hypothetical protein